MANSPVLTDGAKFKCAHMPAPIGVTEGITISLTASKINVDKAKPILNGATISGFTTEKGCTFADASGPKPCISFALTTVPATGLLDENNQRVYTDKDKSAISLVPSTGNFQPGLTIIESQNKLKA
ncbi:MAG: hypothetical protein WCH01_00460 [Methylococcaceae bacterium]